MAKSGAAPSRSHRFTVALAVRMVAVTVWAIILCAPARHLDTSIDAPVGCQHAVEDVVARMPSTRIHNATPAGTRGRTDRDRPQPSSATLVAV